MRQNIVRRQFEGFVDTMTYVRCSIGEADRAVHVGRGSGFEGGADSIGCCGVLACRAGATEAVAREFGLAFCSEIEYVRVGHRELFARCDIARRVDFEREGSHVEFVADVWAAAARPVNLTIGNFLGI